MISPQSKDRLASSFKSHNEKLYPFFCDLSRTKVAVNKSVGTCSEQRHSPTSHSSDLDWHLKRTKISNLIKKHFFKKGSVDASIESIELASSAFIDEMTRSTDFPGVGCFLATQFLQLSSLLGLTPLGCCSFAMVRNPDLGSGNFMQLCAPTKKMNSDDCHHTFNGLLDGLGSIWDDGKVSKALVENTMCELSRSYWKTCSKVMKQKKSKTVKMKDLRKTDLSKLPPVNIIRQNETREESDARDVFYSFSDKEGIQPVFKVRYSGDGATKSKPILIMKLFRDSGSSEILKLTNWKSSGGPSMIKWQCTGKSRDLTTGLAMSRSLERILESRCN